ncbi:hypothetical protein DZC52_11685 [Wenzhouxiangella sediminis]|uniref:Uncharacterized protein n=1 Tax=Wenzhouxiangella sediminis TaxID=1792836 RepID=A0A3E1K6U4_9GAMM|nr:hypothetical protein DZC52_11685 [Wenzhouxiangella sediminis]
MKSLRLVRNAAAAATRHDSARSLRVQSTDRAGAFGDPTGPGWIRLSSTRGEAFGESTPARPDEAG